MFQTSFGVGGWRRVVDWWRMESGQQQHGFRVWQGKQTVYSRGVSTALLYNRHNSPRTLSTWAEDCGLWILFAILCALEVLWAKFKFVKRYRVLCRTGRGDCCVEMQRRMHSRWSAIRDWSMSLNRSQKSNEFILSGHHADRPQEPLPCHVTHFWCDKNILDVTIFARNFVFICLQLSQTFLSSRQLSQWRHIIYDEARLLATLQRKLSSTARYVCRLKIDFNTGEKPTGDLTSAETFSFRKLVHPRWVSDVR